MKVTEVRLTKFDTPRSRALAVGSFSLDDELVVHDVRVVRLDSGKLIVAMPSKVRFDQCNKCHARTELLHRHCHACGSKLDETTDRLSRQTRGGEKPKVYSDLIHPLSLTLRDEINRAVLAEMEAP